MAAKYFEKLNPPEPIIKFQNELFPQVNSSLKKYLPGFFTGGS